MAWESELVEEIRGRIRGLPEVDQWPDVRDLIARETRSQWPCWEYPLDACAAVGGERQQAWPAAAVVFCLLYSIHLADDLLDEDPKGIHHQIGVGAAANAALAFQSAAGILLGQCGFDAVDEAFAHRRLAQAALGTAFGQMLDSQDLPGEESYWRVVKLKTPPLFSFAFFLGALTAGESVERADRIAGLGGVLGEIVQINDDLRDALERPATPDWQRNSTNLAILYGLTAEHAERDELSALKSRVDDPEALAEAQQILVRCGAVSYCAFRLIHSYRAARREIDSLELPAPGSLIELFDHHVAPLKKLLASVGIASPATLFESFDE